MISFGKPGTRINVYYTTGAVATCIDHPKSGKTQLFRRGMSLSDLQRIFENPRSHTAVRDTTREAKKPTDLGGQRTQAERKDRRRLVDIDKSAMMLVVGNTSQLPQTFAQNYKLARLVHFASFGIGSDTSQVPPNVSIMKVLVTEKRLNWILLELSPRLDSVPTVVASPAAPELDLIVLSFTLRCRIRQKEFWH